MKVKRLLAEGRLRAAADFHHAALILQHGDCSADYKLANELAKKGMDLGDERAKWLYAATLDRWLLSLGKGQKFGTQFVQNSKGKWQIAQPIDESVTDKERAKYNVPPLSQALDAYKKKYKIS